ncbi:MAG: GGDEF domain-containing protein [Coriobacteriales bacterium]|nr:GGDEF domain-containing protein [Coriobacteriales bacterium]
MTYYTTVMAITLMALAVLCVLVHENNRMGHKDRRLCYVEFALIAAAALAEWTGVALGHVEGLPAWPILAAKWADYVLTPLAGASIAWQLRQHNKWEKALNAVLVFNVAFQTFAFATGQMILLDEHNHYSHTSLHVVYVAIYLTVFAITAIQFVLYGRSFSKQNRSSLYLTVALTIAGVAMQELLGEEVRVAYLSLTLGAAFLYIRNSEFFQLTQDASLQEQQELLMRDDLTGLGSRRAYSAALKEYKENGIPSGLAVFVVDINGLKEVNDSLGHGAGDTLIQATANCIRDVFAPEGDCYRTGGDEFVVLVSLDKAQAEARLATLQKNSLAWRGDMGQVMHLAAGYALAADWPDAAPEGLVTQADYAMYNAKEAYYRQEGRDRRQSR